LFVAAVCAEVLVFVYLGAQTKAALLMLLLKFSVLSTDFVLLSFLMFCICSRVVFTVLEFCFAGTAPL